MNRQEAQRLPKSQRLERLMPEGFFGGRKGSLWHEKRFLAQNRIQSKIIHSKGFPVGKEVYYAIIPGDLSREQVTRLIRLLRSSPYLVRLRRSLLPTLMRIAKKRNRFDCLGGRPNSS
jgi:hypothetical protein